MVRLWRTQNPFPCGSGGYQRRPADVQKPLRGKFEKNKGPAAKKMKTSMERSFSEDEYEDEEEFMEPHLTKQLVEAYKVESL